MDIPDRLVAGYRKFRAGRYVEQVELYKELALGQQPPTMVIGCADSRVDPATIFSAGPGELFVVRNVAALVPPDEPTGTYHGTSAALEFAVTVLKVRNIIVMGHGMCGGVAAALAGAAKPQIGRFIGPWVEMLAEPRDRLLQTASHMSEPERQKALEWLAVKHSLDNLRSFPFVATAIASGQLRLDGAWFSIAEGQLQWLDPKSGHFSAVVDQAG